jgi:hypothetical protein
MGLKLDKDHLSLSLSLSLSLVLTLLLSSGQRKLLNKSISMEHIKENDFFTSTDIALISAALCCGYRIDEVDRSNPARVALIIRRDNGLNELIKRYFAHQLKVDPLAYFHALKEVKSLIYHT